MRYEVGYVPFGSTSLVNKLVRDYLQDDAFLKPFHSGYPDLKNIAESAAFRKQIPLNRKTLTAVLTDQYRQSGILGPGIEKQIQRLEEPNTFTVTTGQQVGIFLGPAYTLMKILSCIRLAEELNRFNPENHYIPVFWMATEDHDVEEIRHHWYKGELYSWETKQTGPVGRFHTQGLQELIRRMRGKTGLTADLSALFDLFEKAYAAPNLADATRRIAHELFSARGLICLDADDVRLKRGFIPIVEQDLIECNSYNLLQLTNQKLSTHYPIQVKGREVNFFWMNGQARLRIERSENGFRTSEGKKEWTTRQILEELKSQPENFSPNVVMRPLYQEFILPNLAYIGGAAEIAYWMETKAIFDRYGMPFPKLVMRNSMTLMARVESRKVRKYGILDESLFLPLEELLRKHLTEHFGENFLSSDDWQLLEPFFQRMEQKAGSVASSKVQSLLALKKRWSSDVEKFNKKLFRYRRKLEHERIQALENIHHMVFPKGNLQERHIGIPELVAEAGLSLFQEISQAIQPLNPQMVLLKNMDQNLT